MMLFFRLNKFPTNPQLPDLSRHRFVICHNSSPGYITFFERSFIIQRRNQKYFELHVFRQLISQEQIACQYGIEKIVVHRRPFALPEVEAITGADLYTHSK